MNQNAIPIDKSKILLDYSALRDIGITYCAEHIRRLELSGLFPQRVRLGPGRVAWRLSEIEDWLDSRPVGLQ